jgi:hypothetical protein
MEPVLLQAQFSKATTLVDGGWRLSFDLGEDMDKEVTEVRKLKDEHLFIVVLTEAEYIRQRGKA